jgi:hypothetical protein
MKWIWVGLLSGLTGFYIFSLFHFRSAWIAHAIAVGFVVAAIVIVTALWRAKSENRIRIAGLNGFIIGVAVASSLCILASIASLLSVTKQARSAAGDAQFCIQVPDNRGDYRPAGALLDFSGLTMWADGSGSVRLQHHAILVVGNETDPKLYHWSYRKRKFEAGVLNEKVYGPALTCTPTRNFIDSLPTFFPRTDETQYLRFSKQEAYRIPNIYQPRWSGGQGRTLRLAAKPPDFGPLKTQWKDLPWLEWDRNSVFIERNPNWLLSLLKSNPEGQVVEQGTEFGLQKRLIILDGRDGKRYESFQYRVYGNETNSLNTTLVSCSAGSDRFPPSCQHRFLNGGRHFYFVHRPEDVPQWREMQKKVLDLLASFEVSGADTKDARELGDLDKLHP